MQTAPRFSYLPVSNPALNPSALRKGAVNTSQAAGMTSGLVAGRLAASSPAGGPFEVLDQTGNYSFANISVGRVVATGSAEQKSAQSSDSTPFQVCRAVTQSICAKPSTVEHMLKAHALSCNLRHDTYAAPKYSLVSLLCLQYAAHEISVYILQLYAVPVMHHTFMLHNYTCGHM